MAFSCKTCNVSFKLKTNFARHELSKKHLQCVACVAQPKITDFFQILEAKVSANSEVIAVHDAAIQSLTSKIESLEAQVAFLMQALQSKPNHTATPAAPPVEEPAASPMEEPAASPVEEPAAPPVEEPAAPPVEEPAVSRDEVARARDEVARAREALGVSASAVGPRKGRARGPQGGLATSSRKSRAKAPPAAPPAEEPAVPPAEEPAVPPAEEPKTNIFAQDMQKLVDFLEIIGVPFDKNNKLHRYGLQTMKSNLDRVVKRGDVEGVEDWLQSLNDPFDYTKRLFP
jgi:hypothetical protein